eukprot:COSAG01_NODE_1775_length_9260_cov_58.468784_3_plen_234_part_00
MCCGVVCARQRSMHNTRCSSLTTVHWHRQRARSPALSLSRSCATVAAKCTTAASTPASHRDATAARTSRTRRRSPALWPYLASAATTANVISAGYEGDLGMRCEPDPAAHGTGAGEDNGIDYNKNCEISLRFHIFAMPLSPPAPVDIDIIAAAPRAGAEGTDKSCGKRRHVQQHRAHGYAKEHQRVVGGGLQHPRRRGRAAGTAAEQRRPWALAGAGLPQRLRPCESGAARPG